MTRPDRALDNPEMADVADPIWAVIRHHIAAEDALDVERTLATITDDCHYEFPFEGVVLDGATELTPYYRELFNGNWPGEIVEKTFPRWWLCNGTTIFYESQTTFRSADGDRTSRSAAALSVRSGQLSQEIIFLTIPSPWTHPLGRRIDLLAVGASARNEASADPRWQDIQNHLDAFVSGKADDLRQTIASSCEWEWPFEQMSATGTRWRQSVDAPKLPVLADHALILRFWPAANGDIVVQWVGVTRGRPLSHRDVIVSVLSLEGALVSRHLSYSVAGLWNETGA